MVIIIVVLGHNALGGAHVPLIPIPFPLPIQFKHQLEISTQHGLQHLLVTDSHSACADHITHICGHNADTASTQVVNPEPDKEQ